MLSIVVGWVPSLSFSCHCWYHTVVSSAMIGTSGSKLIRIISCCIVYYLILTYFQNASIVSIVTAFWGEEEIQVVATMGQAKDLPNIWPTQGLTGFELNGPLQVFLMGCSKLVAVSFTVAGGLRGGKLVGFFYSLSL